MNEEQMDNISDQENENVAGQTMEAMGEPNEEAAEVSESEENSGGEGGLPDYAKERIGKLQKRYNRDMRRMEAKIRDLQNQNYGGNSQAPVSQQSYGAEEMPHDDAIHRAVTHALSLRDAQEQQAKEREKLAHVHKQYDAFQNHLDNASDKYEDFDEVVRGENAPYTEAMRDTALLLPNPADVLYKLGKNPNELSRISKLHPLDQAKELIKLSHSLAAAPNKGPQAPRQLSQIKSNPITSRGAVSDATPVGDLRRRMSDSNWR